jgi:hypothetical protein
VKPREWAYFSTETLKLLEKYAGRRVVRELVHRYVKRHGLLAPKYMQKAAWRLMVSPCHGRSPASYRAGSGGLKVSGARYEDPLAEADECYPRMVEALNPYRLEETSPLLACAKLHKQSKRQKA